MKLRVTSGSELGFKEFTGNCLLLVEHHTYPINKGNDKKELFA